MKLGTIVLDSDNAEELSDFYVKLLGWTKNVQVSEGEKWIILYNEKAKETPLLFQENSDYKRPIWPTNNNHQQQMMHLDFFVKRDEFESKVKHAINCGVQLSETQFSDSYKVMIDPSGHPFCIVPSLDELGQFYTE